MHIKKTFGAIAVLLLFISGSSAEEIEQRFDILSQRYAATREARAEVSGLRKMLEAEADTLQPLELWRSLFVPGTTPEKGAANSLALLKELVKDGDPAKWEGAAGFVLPSLVPKPLMAADAIYMAAHFLLDMDSPASGELASWLLQRFSDSPKAKFFFVLTAPEEYSILTRTMTGRGILPPFGRWTGGETEGRLPFAAPVRGSITQESAELAGMVFLNAAGQPVSNGIYAWDRRTGRIYHVTEVWYDY